MKKLNYKIKNVEDVKRFFSFLIKEKQLIFHPDNPISDYVNIETGEKTFTMIESIFLQKLMNTCFEVCEKSKVCIYSIGMEVQSELLL